MKKTKSFKAILLFTIFFSPLLWKGAAGEVKAQCYPMIIIDGNKIIADQNAPLGLSLPTWLAAGQTLNIGQYVYSISVVELKVNGSALDYSQNLSVNSVQTVPSNKVWKIEAINKNAALPSTIGATYSIPGTYIFTTPCASIFRVQVWGAGGSGGGGNSCNGTGSGGGGGGGYSEGFYQLAPSTNYSIYVGAGGAAKGNNAGNGASGTASSVGALLSANGGAGGLGVWCGGGGQAGGTGGIGSGGQINFNGQAGAADAGNGGKGGDAAYGNNFGGFPGMGGNAPGGGGGGANITTWTSGAGADGKVIISAVFNAPDKVPCATLYTYSNGGVPATCPSGWTDLGFGLAHTGEFIRSCYRCD